MLICPTPTLRTEGADEQGEVVEDRTPSDKDYSAAPEEIAHVVLQVTSPTKWRYLDGLDDEKNATEYFPCLWDTDRMWLFITRCISSNVPWRPTQQE